MSNHEIRQKAWRLYRQQGLTLFFLAFCYCGLGGVINFIAVQWFGLNEIVPEVISLLLLSPLTLGAVLCLVQMWKTQGQAQYRDLLFCYRTGSGWGGAILLRILKGLAAVIPIIVPLVLIHPALIILGLIVGLGVAFWLILRIYMADVLFVSEQTETAWEAICHSFSRTEGLAMDLFSMLLVIELPQIAVEGLVMLLQSHVSSGTAQALSFGALIFTLLYAPFGVTAGIGWVVERINDAEQPQELHNEPPKNPLLRDIANDLGKGKEQPQVHDKS